MEDRSRAPLLPSDVGICTQLTNCGLQGTIHNCRELTSLSISGCVRITSCTLETVGDLCPRLTSLNLRLCEKVTDQVWGGSKELPPAAGTAGQR